MKLDNSRYFLNPFYEEGEMVKLKKEETEASESSKSEEIDFPIHTQSTPSHTEEMELHKCLYCKKTFYGDLQLTKHLIMTHSETEPDKCRICNFSASTAQSLGLHINRHTGEKLNKCLKCEMSFNQRAHMKRHMLIHNGDRLHKCSQCEKSFFRNYTLKRHILTHSKAKPYKCTTCSYSATTSQSLDFHTSIHTGEKPYKCSQCKMTFRQPTHMKKHMLKHLRWK